MLELREIDLVYNHGSPSEVRALSKLSLAVERGEFVTVVGSNGAGKSSTIQVISGAVRPTRGQVLIEGRDVTRLPDYRRAGLVGRVFDNPHAGTVPAMSIEENLALALSRGRRRGLHRAVDKGRRTMMRDALAGLGLGLERRLSDPVRLLSAGQRQSLTMVMSTLTTPGILLLDEHLAALDPATQARVLAITIDLVDRLGCATMMVTHNMQHAIDVGNRLLVMSQGRIIADFRDEEKRELSVRSLIDRIAGVGDALSDRMALEGADLSVSAVS